MEFLTEKEIIKKYKRLGYNVKIFTKKYFEKNKHKINYRDYYFNERLNKYIVEI